MNIHYHMEYVHSYAHIEIMQPHHTDDTLDLSDISKFEDLMTTSSNEGIPALDEVGYWNLCTMVRNEHLYLYELLHFSV